MDFILGLKEAHVSNIFKVHVPDFSYAIFSSGAVLRQSVSKGAIEVRYSSIYIILETQMI